MTPNTAYRLYPGPLVRYTFNISPSLALEGDASYNFRDENYSSFAKDGAVLLVGGLKAGWRAKHIGVFGTIKPGFILYPNGLELSIPTIKFFEQGHFVLQEGATVEYYPSRRWIVRADIDQLLTARFDHTTLHTSNVVVDYAGSIEQHLNLALSANYRLGRLREESESVPRAERVEAGVLFALQVREHLEFNSLSPDRGGGAWVSVPLQRYVSLDAAAFYLPHDDHFDNPQDGGPETELYGGLKFGIRRDRLGYFAKVRPGFIEFGHGLADLTAAGPDTFIVQRRHVVNFALDTGGVIEYYPSRHAVLRIDAGNAFIHYHGESIGVQPLFQNRVTEYIDPIRRSSILITVGAGWRF